MRGGTINWKKAPKKPAEPTYIAGFSAEFVDLQRKWYAKLKRSGFRDLEFFLGNGDTTGTMLRDSIGAIRKAYRPETEYYYRKADWYLQHHKFETPRHRWIWKQHCKGLTDAGIAYKLKKSRTYVSPRVKAMRVAMLADPRFEKMEAADVVAEARRFELKLYGKDNRKKR